MAAEPKDAAAKDLDRAIGSQRVKWRGCQQREALSRLGRRSGMTPDELRQAKDVSDGFQLPEQQVGEPLKRCLR